MTPPPDPVDWPTAFPPEHDWLELPASHVSGDFVERTWQRVQREVFGRAEAEEDAPDLPAGMLAAHRVPEPSPGFVAATLARVQREGSPEWQAFLSKYAVPQPSPDFVDRVLAALREPGARRGLRPLPPPQRRVAARGIWAAAAACLAIGVGLIALRQPADRSLPFERLTAEAFSPDPWATAFSARQDRGLRVRRTDAALQFAALAGLQERD